MGHFYSSLSLISVGRFANIFLLLYTCKKSAKIANLFVHAIDLLNQQVWSIRTSLSDIYTINLFWCKFATLWWVGEINTITGKPFETSQTKKGNKRSQPFVLKSADPIQPSFLISNFCCCELCDPLSVQFVKQAIVIASGTSGIVGRVYVKRTIARMPHYLSSVVNGPWHTPQSRPELYPKPTWERTTKQLCV